MKTAHAGTLESMDCIATATERTPGSGNSISVAGGGSVRFRSAMERKITEVLISHGAVDININVQDNGAIDIVLGARVEAAVRKLMGGAKR